MDLFTIAIIAAATANAYLAYSADNTHSLFGWAVATMSQANILFLQ